jgi:MurNAc alpha-1-phosphate uridylyltransferase
MKTALILAAGRGERLKPLTNIIPKPMISVESKPLIEHHIYNLAQEGFTKIIINHAHLGDQIRKHLKDGKAWGVHIEYSPEPPGALETGGGIFNALPLLGKEPFLCLNADLYTDMNFSKISLISGSLAHLMLVPNPAHNNQGDFGLDEESRITNDNRGYTFSGISCYDPKLFLDQKPGRYSVVPLLRTLAEKKQVSGEIFKGSWADIGSKERLQFIYKKYYF